MSDNIHPSASSSLVLEFEELCPTLPCLLPNPSFPVCHSALSSQSHDSDGLIVPAVERISDLTEQSISQQDRPSYHDDNTNPAPAFPVQDVFHAQKNHLSLDLEDTHQRNGTGGLEGERHTDTVQTRETVVYISDTESSADLSEGSRLVSKEVCNQTEIDPKVLSCSLHDKLSTGTQPEECQREVNGSESESLRSSLVLLDVVPETHSITEVEPKDLIRIESLDLVFQTSVDGSEEENGDMEAFFQQLDTEGRAYWAEPILVSNASPVLEESDSFVLDESSSTDRAMTLSASSSTTIDTNQTSRDATASSDTPSSLSLPLASPVGAPDPKPSSCSVSVQMSSSPSSHIVHRTDVPYMTDSKCTLLPSVLPLDTSTPFRAVQSWTDLQIQRNTHTQKLSHGALHAAPKEAVSTCATDTTPALDSSSSPYFPLMSNDSQSQESLPGKARNDHPISVSVDKGLWADEDEEVDKNGIEDEERFWEGNQTATVACCRSCDHQCTCTRKSYDEQHALGNNSYSLDELEEMMLCLQRFRSVLGNMEEQLSEDQAAVYNALSDQDREKVQDIEELRRAVKQEAGELEMQLNELAHHYDDSLKMKMHRLLDEQSLLCSQLSVPASPSPAPNRTVATQCCLLPWIPPADLQSAHVSSWRTWDAYSLRQSPPGSKCMCEGLRCSHTKADKLDMMGILQRLKESLRHSVNTDSLE
ncbi:uncharacterized protein LOC115025816 [Cottoperca gobio]|uniref:Uncharacterized protein LOC115025816 n=1 Tax=Cottoperca gobio TaxID=56716 RepID=A0A6J2RXV0_COTGO|nr:uncharacterized protein LOC115025816 [Cottoperca gobio]